HATLLSGWLEVFVSLMRAFFKNGIGKYVANSNAPSVYRIVMGNDFTMNFCFSSCMSEAVPKKSPAGASIEGCLWPSHQTRKRARRKDSADRSGIRKASWRIVAGAF